MTSKEFAEADKEAMVDKIQKLFEEIGISDYLLLASVPLEDSNKSGIISGLPRHPNKLYELTRIFVTALYKSGGHKAIVELAHGLEDALNSVASEPDESTEDRMPGNLAVISGNQVPS